MDLTLPGDSTTTTCIFPQRFRLWGELFGGKLGAGPRNVNSRECVAATLPRRGRNILRVVKIELTPLVVRRTHSSDSNSCKASTGAGLAPQGEQPRSA